MPVLDRRPQFDPRSKSFNVRALIGAVEPRSYTWACPVVLDQGVEGACVGHAWTHEAAAKPVVRPVTQAMAFDVYREAQRLDQWPGEEPAYSGTSVLAGAKAMQRRGLLREYRWAFTLNDALATISRRGPVVLGVDWWTGMLEPDPDGYLHLTGRVEGGHAILAVGVNVKARRITLHNSWGASWGIGGRAYLSWDDLGQLLDGDGEACVPVLR